MRYTNSKKIAEKWQRKWTFADVGKHWDKTEGYDEINKKTYSYFRRFTDGFRLSDIKNNSYVLDICCRTGNGTSFFAKKRKIRAFCMDVSDKMLKICKSRLKSEKVNFKVKKFTKLPLPARNNTFDNILCFETLEHMPNAYLFLKELSRVLKKKGELILTCPNPKWEFVHWFAALTGIHHGEGPHKFINRKKVKELLEMNGFKIKRFETTVFIPYGPRFLTKIGEIFEKVFKKNLMNVFGLRHIFICEKI